MFLFYFYTLLQKYESKKSFFEYKNHISNFSGKGTIPAQAAYLPPKPGKQPNIRQAAHNTQATGQPGMQRAKMKTRPSGRPEIAQNHLTRLYWPTGQATEHRESGVGRAKTMKICRMRVLRHQIEVLDCESGEIRPLRPARQKFLRLFQPLPLRMSRFFPTFVTNKSINTFYIDTMEFEGTVYKIMPVTKGTSARGDWQRQDVVFEMNEGSFARKICVTFFNKPEDVARLKEGAAYTVSVNIESREYNGRWYTDIRAWRIQPKQAESAAPMPDMPPIPEEPSYASSPAEVDDLPF